MLRIFSLASCSFISFNRISIHCYDFISIPFRNPEKFKEVCHNQLFSVESFWSAEHKLLWGLRASNPISQLEEKDSRCGVVTLHNVFGSLSCNPLCNGGAPSFRNNRVLAHYHRIQKHAGKHREVWGNTNRTEKDLIFLGCSLTISFNYLVYIHMHRTTGTMHVIGVQRTVTAAGIHEPVSFDGAQNEVKGKTSFIFLHFGRHSPI